MDLFAGCGGLGLGLEKAGFESVYVNELNSDALGTYLRNRPASELSKTSRHSNDITELTRNGDDLDALARDLRRDHGEISLVVGGPPCQGYSSAGHRRTFKLDKREIPSNHLYQDMAKVISRIAPRAFVFENVAGLLNSKWTQDGAPGEVWTDVRRTFERIETTNGQKTRGYDVRFAKVFAKDYGVPQNRPRLLLVGIRSDITPWMDSEGKGVADGFLPTGRTPAPNPVELWGDLVDPGWSPGGTTTRYPQPAVSAIQRELRTRPDGTVARKGSALTEHVYSRHSTQIMEKFLYMIRNGGAIPPHMQTKKFAQRVVPMAWGPGGPNITATSLPDDYVHFEQPRTPTVREWARLQTFPDWYQFAGPRTTGGRRRAGDPSIDQWVRQVPRYTQIGNAVPVRLAEAVGHHLSQILDLG